MKEPKTAQDWAKRSRLGAAIGVLVALIGVAIAAQAQTAIGLVSAIVLAICGAAFSALMFIAGKRWSNL